MRPFRFGTDGSDEFIVRLTAPTSGTNDTGELQPGESTQIVLGNGTTKVSIDSSLDDVHNDAKLIEIRITDVSLTDPIPAGDWFLFLRGQTVINGAFNGWIDRDNRGGVIWRSSRRTKERSAPLPRHVVQSRSVCTTEPCLCRRSVPSADVDQRETEGSNRRSQPTAPT